VGQAHDSTQAVRLLEGIAAEFVLADKAYDSNEIVACVEERQAVAVIPPKSNRNVKREYDKTRYKKRNLIERFFGRLKQFRRVATRYDKLSSRYAAFILISAGIIIDTFS
jgi:transposase